MRKEIWFALILALAVVLLAACGDDDGGAGGDIDEGPAADVEGAWTGSYESEDGGRSGEFCVEIDQDGRGISGNVVFAGEPKLEIGGRIANERLSFVWNPGGVTPPADAPSPGLGQYVGGTFTGDVSGDSVSGDWTSLDADRGTWSAERTDAGECPGA